MKSGYVYKIINLINGKWYIGSRRCNSLDEAKKDNYFGSGKALKFSIKKYKKENFEKKILCFVEDAYFYEGLFLTGLNAAEDENSYNLKNGAIGNSIGDFSGQKNGFFNKKHTKESKDLQSKNNYMLGRGGPLHPLYGKKRPELTKEVLGDKTLLFGKKGSYHNKFNPNKIIAIDGEIIICFKSGFDAAKFFNLSSSSRIHRACKHNSNPNKKSTYEVNNIIFYYSNNFERL